MSTVLAEPTTDALAASAGDEPLYEIIHGERVDLPPMSIYANLIAGELYFALKVFLRNHPLGTAVMESLLILDRTANLRRRPDVALVGADRWPLDREVPETGACDVVPTLAIEVISPHDVSSDVEGKVIDYFAHGVEAVWVVQADHRRIYCYTSPMEITVLDQTGTLDGGDLLPGFTLPLNNLFRRTVAATQA